MTKKPRRLFTDEQKAEAVNIVKQSGKPVSQVAKEMGLTESALRKWVKQSQIDAQPRIEGELTSAEQQELLMLRRELKRVKMERDFLKKAANLLRKGKLRPYELIHAEKVNFPINLMCRVLNLTRSGYYAWCKRNSSPRARENQILSEQIVEIFEASRGTYGSPRMHEALLERGFEVGLNRVARLMAELELRARPKRKFKATTDSEHSFPISDNLLNREFKTTEPDRVWVADMTYIWTGEGWLYLAVIIDLFSRRVVGWSMADHMRTELVLTALEAALGQRQASSQGLIFHSDRGSQYASNDYQIALQNAGIQGSMSRRANCWDNAVAESFFGTIKMEFIHRMTFADHAEAKTAISEWIEVFYNRQRIHSTIGFLSPVQFEEDYWLSLSQPVAA
ncbi:MAG: IS3 family transposase [Synechococcales cyanobacterium CRU_2_2]|nr:IS3 family transposase [Synechococcales cyanobacterium CRU_2_2]